jgi:proteasome maturation protein
LNLARQAYGMHAPIKMMMEKSIVEKVTTIKIQWFNSYLLSVYQRQRMPILPSSNLHLDILMGKDELIDYEDFLNGNIIYVSPN